MDQNKPIVFFDGHCLICNSWVNFMLRRDRSRNLYYASLQGETAKKQLDPKYLQTVDTIILKKDNVIHLQSGASLRAISELGGIYKLASILLFVPPFIRNWVYGTISKNRYNWFGRQEVCRIPTKAEADRLLS